MEKRKNKVIDCDVFCLKEFYYEGDVVITGNFYAEGAVDVEGALETGEDIIVRSQDFFCTQSLRSFGEVDIQARALDSAGIFASEGFEFIPDVPEHESDDILFTM